MQQGLNEDRTIEQTLSLGWELLSILPVSELKRVKPEEIEKYLPKKDVREEQNEAEEIKNAEA